MNFITKFLLSFSLCALGYVSIVAPSAQAAPSFLAGYEVPRDCEVSWLKKVTQEILITNSEGVELGCVDIEWLKEGAGKIFAKIKILRVNPAYQKKGFGKMLFDIALYRLIKDFGASQVTWGAYPYEHDRLLKDLVALYVRWGGVEFAEEDDEVEMCLSDAKLAEITGMSAEPVVPAPYSLKTNSENVYSIQLSSSELVFEKKKRRFNELSLKLCTICFSQSIADGVKGSWDVVFRKNYVPVGSEHLEMIQRCANFDAE